MLKCSEDSRLVHIETIRHAYSHIPHAPKWAIDSGIQDSHFEVKDIIKLDTSQLHDNAIRWQDYGGLVSLFRLSKWVRLNILKGVNDDLANKRKQYIQSGIMQQGRCVIINEKSPLFISNSKK